MLSAPLEAMATYKQQVTNHNHVNYFREWIYFTSK